MADKKVYGMYENKCKEEVIPMQNICTFTGEINAEKEIWKTVYHKFIY